MAYVHECTEVIRGVFNSDVTDLRVGNKIVIETLQQMTYGGRERESYNRLMYALEDGRRERQGRREREAGRKRKLYLRVLFFGTVVEPTSGYKGRSRDRQTDRQTHTQCIT